MKTIKSDFVYRFLILLSAVLVLCGVTRAETHYRPHISVGAHAGVAMSKVSFTPEVPQSWYMGPTGGVQIRYAEEKLVGVLAELNFVSRGWKETFEDNPGLSYSRSMFYVSLPIMTHITFGSPRLKCFVNLGPEIGYMVSNSIKSNFDYTKTAGIIDPSRRVNQMSMEITGKFDYGICAGVGGEYYVNPRNSVYLEARFYYGLGNIFPSSKSDEFAGSRSMTLSVTAGYNFRIR